MNASDYPFESFNARALSPRQVARGFVPPQSFYQLCKRRHSVVAGPRGSGKTTLLKMLQTSALRAWDHPEAEKLRSQIDFTGVFIPTDRTWGEQLCAVGSGKLTDQQRDVLGVAAFTTQILRATVSALIERVSPDKDSVSPEPTSKILVRPISADHRYDVEVERANMSLLEGPGATEVFAYPVEVATQCLELLDALVSRLSDDYRVIALPFGPKLFALCSMLMACIYYPRVGVWRISNENSDGVRDQDPSETTVCLRVRF